MSQFKNVKSGLHIIISLGIAVFVLSGYANAQPGDAAPMVTLEKSTYASGENIVVNFSNGPGNKGDWIAVYAKGVVPGSGIFTELWYYSNGKREAGENGASEGTVVFDSASDNPENTEVDWPLADGIYDVYFMCCEEYDVLAGPVALTIDSAGGG
jgi:hypothetical protein